MYLIQRRVMKGTLLFTYLVFFCIGSGAQTRNYLDLALKTEHWLASQQIIGQDSSLTWPMYKDSSWSTFSIYNGTPGIILFYLELYHTTGNKSFLDKAIKAVPPVLRYYESDTAYYEPGLFIGSAGASYMLYKVYEATHNFYYLDNSRALLDSLCHRPYMKLIQKDSLYADIMYGYAGIGCMLLYADDHQIFPDALQQAKKTGDILLALSIPDSAGLLWKMQAADTSEHRIFPNFSHGTAGVAYFLASLYEKTHDQKYLDAALQGAKYLSSITNDSGWVYHRSPDGTDRYYLSWCHGPAGTSRLYYKLFLVTGEKQWQDKIFLAANSIQQCGIPDHFTAGYWNNVSQCCGNAGVAEFFLSLYLRFQNKDYLSFSLYVLENLIGRGTTEGDGMYWIQAENRISPDELFAQTGMMQGAAGIGLVFLHMDAVMNHRFFNIVLPDNPFY